MREVLSFANFFFFPDLPITYFTLFYWGKGELMGTKRPGLLRRNSPHREQEQVKVLYF